MTTTQAENISGTSTTEVPLRDGINAPVFRPSLAQRVGIDYRKVSAQLPFSKAYPGGLKPSAIRNVPAYVVTKVAQAGVIAVAGVTATATLVVAGTAAAASLVVVGAAAGTGGLALGVTSATAQVVDIAGQGVGAGVVAGVKGLHRGVKYVTKSVTDTAGKQFQRGRNWMGRRFQRKTVVETSVFTEVDLASAVSQ